MPHLEQIYSLTGEGTYLLGVKLRLIPIINKVSNLRTRSKVERPQNRQAVFDKHIIQKVSCEIVDLDTISKKDDRSL